MIARLPRRPFVLALFGGLVITLSAVLMLRFGPREFASMTETVLTISSFGTPIVIFAMVGLKASEKRATCGLDERERIELNDARFVAYRVALGFGAIAMTWAAIAFLEPTIAVLTDAKVVFTFAFTGFMTVFFLPQSIVAWKFDATRNDEIAIG